MVLLVFNISNICELNILICDQNHSSLRCSSSLLSSSPVASHVRSKLLCSLETYNMNKAGTLKSGVQSRKRQCLGLAFH